MIRNWAAALVITGSLLLAWGSDARDVVGEPIAYLAYTDGYWQVWVIAPDGSGARQVTRSAYEKTRCSWFPDGRSLLVNSLAGELFKVDRASGSEQRLSMPLAGATDGVISPDGSQIAFSLSTAGSVDHNQIWTVKLDGSEPRRLTTMPGLQHEPQWSADGAWIYFLSGNGGQAHDIWRVSTETLSREQMTVDSLYHFELALARDGRLAYSSNQSGNYEVYVQKGADAPIRLTSDPALDGHPTWSPDDETIVFQSLRSGTMNLWRVVATGGEAQQITRHTEGARGPMWWRAPATR